MSAIRKEIRKKRVSYPLECDCGLGLDGHTVRDRHERARHEAGRMRRELIKLTGISSARPPRATAAVPILVGIAQLKTLEFHALPKQETLNNTDKITLARMIWNTWKI